jgi:deoxyhypusine monooxygenase
MESYQLIASLFPLMNEGSEESLDMIRDVCKSHPCPVVRHEAVYCLSEVPSKESVEFLKKILEEDSDPLVKHEALVSLGTIGKEDLIPSIKEYTKHENTIVSDSALVSIQRIQDYFDYENEVKKNPAVFIEELKDFSPENQNRRIQIIFQLMLLGARGDKGAVDAIYFSLVNDPSEVVRHEAGYALGEVGTEYAVELMAKALETEKSPVVKHEVLFALGTTGRKDALPAIERYLNSEEYIVRESAKIGRDRITKLEKPYSGVREGLEINN